ncbi:helix-turn-helix domain-containing protein [uncultured Haliea sp.]|uniref:helix-turn-helix transcriptional regulator n=1 Tax=uncultured Haliea sp. TaxID=622616 RepID=UPI0030DC42BA
MQSPDNNTTPQLPSELTALPRLMSQRELAVYLGKSTAWCERARWAGEGPRYVKLGRHVRYRADDVLAWIEANAKHSTAGV